MQEIHLDKTASTHAHAKAHAATFPTNQITCITAEEQTAGKGRYQRPWHSPRGVNIYASFVFSLSLKTSPIETLAQILAFTLAQILQQEKLTPTLKWPNDIRLNNRKVAGTLCETIFQKDHILVIASIGINVNMEEKELSHIDQPATSLKLIAHRTWDRPALLHSLQRQFQQNLTLFQQKGFTPFHNPMEEILAYKGKSIRCTEGNKTWEGICHSLTPDGRLNLLLPNQTLHPLTSGDIEPQKQ